MTFKNTKIGVIYLTFDDGPSREWTPTILDILKQYDAKATFFIVPKGNTVDDLLRREKDEGHSIGIHSYSHIYRDIYKSEDNLYNDISKVNTKLYSVLNEYSYLYRYPGGSSNTIYKHFSSDLISKSSLMLHQMGYHYFDWNISSGDAIGRNVSYSRIIYNVIKNLRKDRVNVVLMHDTKKNTAFSLEKILQYGINNGYEFKRITMDTPEIHHNN